MPVSRYMPAAELQGVLSPAFERTTTTLVHLKASRCCCVTASNRHGAVCAAPASSAVSVAGVLDAAALVEAGGGPGTEAILLLFGKSR